MYVKAPRRSSNGTTNTVYDVGYRQNAGGWYSSPAAAMAASDTYTSQLSCLYGRTTRGMMQSGRIGPTSYVDTDYFASYHEYKSRGRVKFLLKNFTASQWQSEAHPLAFTLGLSTNWTVFDNSDIVSPWGTSNSVAAVYNRAVMANLRNRIRAELNVKALGTNFDAAEALTGLKPTVRMVSETTIRLMQAFLAARKGNWQRVAYELGLRQRIKSTKPAELWLEYQYGWKPLVNDIFDGANEIRKAFSQKAPSEDFYTVSRSGAAGLILPPGASSAPIQVTYSNTALAGVKGKLRYTINDSFVAYMSSLRLADPAYIAWTALPYSFIVDWILPVGDMLSALHGHVGLKFRGGHITTRVDAHQSASGGRINPFQGYPSTRSGTATAEVSCVYITRTALSSFPGFAPYVKFPFGGPERIASALALIGSAKRYR